MMSFRKRTVQKPIRGTRTSPHTAQVITSSGNPSLDEILGGGLPIGSICLIEEDRYMTHAKVLAKYFIAEGTLCTHNLFLGSLDDSPMEVLHRLPKALNDEEAELEQSEQQQSLEPTDKNGMRIAFRYNDLPLVNSEKTTAKIGHHFNLMEYMDPVQIPFGYITVWNDSDDESLDNADDCPPLTPAGPGQQLEQSIPALESDANVGNNNTTVDSNTTANDTISTATITPSTTDTTSTPVTQTPPTGSQFFHNARYERLLKRLLSPQFAVKQRTLMRICLTSLGSPLWYDDHFGTDLLKFLTVLRSIVRNNGEVCFITMPMHLIAKYDTSLVPKVRQLVDYAIELESFAGSDRETHPAYKEYSGLLHLHKMSAVNTLAVHMPMITDLAFKLRRKKFVIEKLHLPPDLQETSEATPASEVMPAPNCNAGRSLNSNISMDF